ncbi:ATP-binding protein [Streptomyces sp. NBC_00344]|uniref:ATP-binding protein n=1 Tax=Streptomyces sp. NBC_00344 TaxID=2975720 RepID=UPI002E1C9E8A
MRYLILGATEAQDDHGTAIPVGGPRLRALLAALALRPGRPVTVGALIDDVWADDPPQDAPAALQALVARLRRALGRAAISSTPNGYQLEAGADDVDLHAFERATHTGAAQLEAGAPARAADTFRAALALWRGPALADLPDREHAVRPEARRLAALRQRIEADLRVCATEELVTELTGCAAAHPYDEAFRVQLIRALRAVGRQADALIAYEDARRTLAEGLGTDPGPELGAQYAELLGAQGSGTAPSAPRAPSGNLRPRLTSFVGREPELAAVRADLARHRLVTLTGTGGSGKTRLAEEAAPATAWLVELAPLDDPAGVPGAVISALGLRETVLITHEKQQPPDDPVAKLIEYCTSRPLVLLLDNCEHVIGAAAQLAETLLTHCPQLRILATSREPLGVSGEAVRPVEPLPADPATRLFAERARAVRPDFDPGADRAAVAEICRRLDGLPLAIELAAARLRLLAPRQIADRLDNRFRLLTSGSRTALPRQQTLRAVVDWSWDLLDAGERTVLRQASVFAGGWDIVAAEAVCGGPDDMAALVDKSLVVATPGEDGMRYRMLDTIHEYAAERAADAPDELAAAQRAHAAHYLALAEEAEPLIRSGEQLPWIRRIEAESGNIRVALRLSVDTHDEPAAIRLLRAMGWFWWLRNYRREALDWAGRLVSLGDDPADETDPRYWPRMQLRLFQIFMALESQGQDGLRDPETVRVVERVRAAFSAGGPEAARFPGLLWPFTAFITHLPEDVAAWLDEVVTNCRAYGGDWEVAVALMFRAHMRVDMPGGMEGVDADLAELRDLCARIGDRWIRAQVASASAEAGMARGHWERTREAFEEALRLAREVGAHAEAPFLIARLAELSYRTGDLEQAEKALDEAAAESDRYGVLDARTYISFLRSLLSLERGEPAVARLLFDEARRESRRGTPPPQYVAILDTVEARLTGYEEGPAAGLRSMLAALRTARDAHCAEIVLAGIADSMASVLTDLGDHRLAVRVTAAAGAWRAGCIRSVVEEARARTVEAGASAALSPQVYAAERASGALLSVADVIVLLDGRPGSTVGR